MSEWSRAGVTPRGVRPPARSATRSLSAMAGEEAEESRLCIRKKHRWFIWRISWFWLQVGEEIDEGEKTSMNEDNSRCSRLVED